MTFFAASSTCAFPKALQILRPRNVHPRLTTILSSGVPLGSEAPSANASIPMDDPADRPPPDPDPSSSAPTKPSAYERASAKRDRQANEVLGKSAPVAPPFGTLPRQQQAWMTYEDRRIKVSVKFLAGPSTAMSANNSSPWPKLVWAHTAPHGHEMLGLTTALNVWAHSAHHGHEMLGLIMALNRVGTQGPPQP